MPAKLAATAAIQAPSSVTAPPRWSETPACAGASDPELFFPLDETGPGGTTAKAVCARCQLRVRCLKYALSSAMTAEIWGGMTTPERDALIRARRADAQQGA